MGLRNRKTFLDKSCFFVTTTCNGHLPLLMTDERKQLVADSLNFVGKKYEMAVFGYVLMPNHLHFLLYFTNENKLSEAMRDLKKFTATCIRKDIEASGNVQLLERLRHEKRQQVFKVWNDRFDDVWIGDKKLLETKLAYIHLNPLQAHWNLVKRPEEYLFSSAAFYELERRENPVELTDYRKYF